MFEEFTQDLDEGHLYFNGGLGRTRQREYFNSTGGSTSKQTLGVTSSDPRYTEKSAAGTLYGGRQYTYDRNHGGRIRAKRKLAKRGFEIYRDLGGPFLTERYEVSEPTHVAKTWYSGRLDGLEQTVDGFYHPSDWFFNLLTQIHARSVNSSMNPTSDLTLRGYGATGIARTIPTKPEMSLSQSIGELKDGLPSMIGDGLRRGVSGKSAGSEYLNYQFGIAPMVRDAKDVLSLTRRYEQIIRQFRRDNNRIVRRSTTLVDEKDEVRSSPFTGYAYHGGGSSAVQSVLTSDNVRYTTETRRKIWFSGAYRIAYPTDYDSLLSEITEFNRVYGVIPTPELAWELLPFSWLVDWFSNVGDVLQNVSLMGSATRLEYGYVMASDHRKISYSGDFGPTYYWLKRDDTSRTEITSSYVHSRKRRLKASPFGFSVRFSELSNAQKAILTALGLSRQRVF